jgi:hypothetical protein
MKQLFIETNLSNHTAAQKCKNKINILQASKVFFAFSPSIASEMKIYSILKLK